MARTFVLIEPVQYVLKQVSCSYGTIPNAPKYYETHRNISLGSNGVDWVHSLRKILKWLRGTNFCINWTNSVCFATSFMQLRNDPNAPKYYKMHWNIGIRSNGMDWLCSLRKIPTWLCATNFCINVTTSPSFAPSFMQLRKFPKCTRTLRNAPKHEFRAQWIGSVALVAKNYNANSWHKLLH